MPISFHCPKCKKKLSVADNLAGKVAQCPCGARLKIPAQSPATAQAATPQPARPQPAAVQQAQPVQQTQQPQATPAANMQTAAAAPLATNPAAATPLPGAQPVSAAPTPQLPTPSPESLQNLNPDFQVQCLQCGQSYPIRPDLYGQTVNCRCGAPIRFEDPLGAGGALTSKDPLGLKQEKDDGQPLAYQSQSKPSRSKLEARKREEEVLKMYIKDEEEFEKVTKPGKRKAEMSEGQAFVAGLTGVSGSTEGELSMTRIISAVVLILLLLGFGIGMILYPDAMDDTSVSSGRGAKAKLLILLWSFPTGIVLTSLGGVLTLLSCIMPKKIFLFLSTPDDE